MKSLLLVIAFFISINSYCQTFNDYSNPQSLFAVNVVRDWSVKYVADYFPSTSGYDVSTSYGRCMVDKISGCNSMWLCRQLCGKTIGTATGCTMGWAIQCAITKEQTIIPPIKTF